MSSNVGFADNDVRFVPDKNNIDFCTIAHESRYNWAVNNFDMIGKKVLDFGYCLF